ncbi:MAG: purine-nucleoside phosphorylase [Pseudonocardiales bacterium]|nr:MAG: purine-nucleoside phosphorylase [Pseudonocardiales bacterium]
MGEWYGGRGAAGAPRWPISPRCGGFPSTGNPSPLGSADVTGSEAPGDPSAAARAAADVLAQRTGVPRHDVAIVLGSGWVPAIDSLGTAIAEVPVTDLPGFLPPAVEGHAGRIRSLTVGDRRVLAFMGRTHLYEGRGVDPVVHGVRVAAAAGCRTIVLTNACGGLRAGLSVGDPVMISDHLNLTGRTPLVGARFVDLTDLYPARLRALVRGIDPTITEGVYAMFPGPQYETPAEVRMAGVLGADLVGMSTVLEAIAARAEGCEVLGLSLVTNLAAGLGDPLDHEEVLAAGRAAATRMGGLLAQVIPQL